MISRGVAFKGAAFLAALVWATWFIVLLGRSSDDPAPLASAANLPAAIDAAATIPATVTLQAVELGLRRSANGVLEVPDRHPSRFQQVRRVEGAVRSFLVGPGHNVKPTSFFLRFAAELGLGSDDQMAPMPATNTVPTRTHCRSHRYQQYHRDVPVLDAFYALLACNDRVVGGLGVIASGLDVVVAPQLTPGNALDAVRTGLEREEPGFELKLVLPARLFVHAPDGVHNRDPVLVYRLLVAGATSIGTQEFLVSAHTGAIVRRRHLSRGVWNNVIASGESQYDGIVLYHAQQDSDTGVLRLLAQNPIKIETRDFNLGSQIANSVEIHPGQSNTAAGMAVERAGLSAHWAVQGAVHYFWEQHGWFGPDGAGINLRIFLRLKQIGGGGAHDFGETDAGWFGKDPYQIDEWQLIALGMGGVDGNGFEFYPLVAPEVLAHELTHAIQYYQIGASGGFADTLEAQGLSESYADIFAVLGEAYLRGSAVDYVIGNDWAKTTRRRMDNPALSVPKPHPVQYLDALWLAGPLEPKPHFWAGPHNRWFYLLAEGGPLVAAIGSDKAGAIAFFAMTQLLFPDATYFDARDAEALAGMALFGGHTQPVASVLDAYAAINIGNGYVNTLIHLPTIDAQDVEPWPVDLGWEALNAESEWEVEISTTPQFETDVIKRTSASLPAGNPPLVHLPESQRPNLHGDTHYYWRVRGHVANGEWQDWRLPVHFHTGKKTVEPLTPSSRERKAFHPWDLTFSWSGLPKATQYEIEVAEAPALPVDWQKPLLSPPAVTGTSLELDVRVDRDHAWRIRAQGPNGDFGPTFGAWTEVPFKTSLPRAELVEPLDGVPRYPWPTDLHWAAVAGADHYLLDLTDCDGVFKSANPNSPLPCAAVNPNLDYEPLKLDAGVLHFPLNVQPEWSYKNVVYWWQVRVIGPPPWFDEGGLPLEDGSWKVDGSDTLPMQLNPPLMPANLPCFDLGQDVTFQWEPVPNAVGYRLRLHEMLAPLGTQLPGTIVPEHGHEVFAQSVPASAGTSLQVPGIGAGPMSGKLHFGYYWHVEADGPDGYRGLEDTVGTPYLIENDTPSPNMLDGHHFGLNDDVVLPWKSDHTLLGGYKVSIYAGGACIDANLLLSAQIPGTSPGKSSAVLGTPLPETELFAWSVSNSFYLTGSQCYGGFMNSPCTTFLSPGPVCGNGVVEGNEECDDGNHAPGDGCSSTCKAALACGQQHADAGGIEISYADQELQLGGNKGTIWITTETYVIPDRLVFRHNDEIIAQVDCAGTDGAETLAVPINGGDSSIFVTVEPDCDNQSTNTKWAYAVSCIDDSATLPPHDSE